MLQPSDAGKHAAITPSDTAEVQNDIRGIYVGGTAGNLVLNYGSGDVTLPVVANSYHPCAGLKLVKVASTAAPLFSVR